MKVFIPSKDRPLQLRTLLESMSINLPNINFDIYILQKNIESECRFKLGYSILRQEFIEKLPNNFSDIWFAGEINFCSQFKEFLRNCENKPFMLLTDDCIFYRYTDTTDGDIHNIFRENNRLCFSFRLGLNTIIQNYLTGELQPELTYYDEIKDDPDFSYIQWNYKNYSSVSNYGYWFSWDGHIYNSRWLLNIVKDLSFENPRALEHQLTTKFKPSDRKYISALETSCLFVNTVNRVQADGPPAGTKHYYSPEELNEKYISGEVIDMKSFAGLELNSCHEEVPLRFKKI